ncbi:glycine cleavage system protein GcvH [Hydrogenibacillus schlegelii]|uniref:Glycine cleavage system H protein n=1 Tax=Hydrogenibacillus schlegelii TaxID=1484 RepID=A0A132N6P9_HYDSH|nr:MULTISPECIES: glycine cleavage system protein GcvH [Hydrogenibacillus]KWX05799.1 glycine cleavage system protein H [Hydrogenibacillus schlegelii]MBE3562477.1 glycine cleavage system protein GcvH [Hydrogenibacillus schlegelii]MBT9281268.1 glycine cleavage system protein GcvH [Hydrogenibacillus schlegelii]OAR03530.1 glycine cleavage system protein H [Hydrogenibacillus schlegelii]QZA32737.1 glycine cleavage system protein GcvH [Hydrogenibacillus sp. N12]
MEFPAELRYSREHEWVRVEGNRAYIGITDFAQDELGDIVYVELPEVGATVTAGEPFGTVESVKTVSELYAPVSGTVVEVNARLADEPELVNRAPYTDGWMIVVEMSRPEELAALLDAEAYRTHIGE